MCEICGGDCAAANPPVIDCPKIVDAQRKRLLPCPFCGSSDLDSRFWASEWSSGPGCNNCGATAEDDDGWNARDSSGLAAIHRLATERLALIPSDLVVGGVLGDLLLDILKLSAPQAPIEGGVFGAFRQAVQEHSASVPPRPEGNS